MRTRSCKQSCSEVVTNRGTLTSHGHVVQRLRRVRMRRSARWRCCLSTASAPTEKPLNDCWRTEPCGRRSLAFWQQYVEALRMYGYAPARTSARTFEQQLKSQLIPRLEFVDLHAYALNKNLVPA